MNDIRAKIEQGQRISEADAVNLFETDDLLLLGELASLANRRVNGDKVYFNVNRHINPTNICVNRCKFCAFSRSENEEGAYEMDSDEVFSQAQKAHADGAHEIHIVGGLHPTLSLEWYEEVIARIKDAMPGMHVKGFTAVEIDHFANISGNSIEEVLRGLKAAGLGSMPGGGAEILAEETRLKICPEKISGKAWLEIMRTAHSIGLKSNATILYGHVESYGDRVEHMRLLRELQDETGGFQVFIPLAFQPKHSELASGSPTTGFDDLKTLAVARLYLDNFKHIKGYWIMLGEKIAQVSLHFGVNDLDGTVSQEKIAHDAGAESSEKMSREDLVSLIKEADKIPVERDSLYNELEVCS